MKNLSHFVLLSLLLLAACDEKGENNICDPRTISEFWINESYDVVMWRNGNLLRLWEKKGSFYVSEKEFLRCSNKSLRFENEDWFFDILHEDSNGVYLQNGEEIHIFVPVTCEKLRNDANLRKNISLMHRQ